MVVISENSIPTSPYSHLLIPIIALLLLIYFLIISKSRPVYLIDFICYLPPPHLRASIANFIEHLEISSTQEREAIDFQSKMAQRSGIGPQTYFPPAVHQLPLDNSLALSRQETESVLFSIVKQILEKHSVNPKSIDILITNCSIFCPTPSISSTVINKFGLRSNVRSFSLSGMGCSAGLVAVGLAKDLLKVSKNSVALVLSMEAVTPSGYTGNTKSMLLANTLFRMGGVAVQSVYQQHDDSGEVGVSLSRSLLHVAAKARISRRHLSISAYTRAEGR